MEFHGNFEELKDLLSEHGYRGEWVQKDEGTIQLRPNSGLTVNWHPQDCTISLQAKFKIVQRIRSIIFGANAKISAKNNADSAMAAVSDQEFKYKQVEEEYRADYDSELIIGLVGAVGTNLKPVVDALKDRLDSYDYSCDEIKISSDIISVISNVDIKGYYERTDRLMTEGNSLREKTGDFGFLAKAASGRINAIRSSRGKEKEKNPMPRRAFIISSLKHPEEVSALRKIYGGGFYLLGIHSSQERRKEFIVKKKASEEEAELLMDRDADEKHKHGQHTRDTYHLSDFFIDLGANTDKFDHDITRCLDLIFGNPFVTPTFDEYAMFMAFSASLRSADMSRQVGAVVTRDCSIVATGANDVPKFGGGLYWPEYNKQGTKIDDKEDGRDYKRKGDTNVLVKNEIIADIIKRVPEEQRLGLKKILIESKLKDITEYGRIVHAEMDAITTCARESVNTKGAHMFCTTFPCHNCAKHLIAAGIGRVVYVEPYPKSKALDFHKDSITLQSEENKVRFEPFVGVGPRSFHNLFSVNLGSGYPIKRKNDDGSAFVWEEQSARLRMQMLPSSYIDREAATAFNVQRSLEKINEPKD